MKKHLFTLFIIGLVSFVSSAQNIMYLMKDGVVIAKFDVNRDIDSIIFYDPIQQIDSSFIDGRDQNVYKYVTIGVQTWMAENLRYLPSVAGPEISSETTPLYYVYDYNGDNVIEAKTHLNYNTYGVLYNWQAAIEGTLSSEANKRTQGVCPQGWHLPSLKEWEDLSEYLGGEEFAGGKLKQTGVEYWKEPNVNATNETRFNALPSGYRDGGVFYGLSILCSFWCSPGDPTDGAQFKNLNNSDGRIISGSSNSIYGYSVRCIRD